MRKIGLATVVALGLVLPVGCGGGGGGGISQLVQNLRACTGDGMGYLIGLTLVFDPILEAIQGNENIPGVSVNEDNSDTHVWSFDYELDLDGDGSADTTIEGTIDFSEDPKDGVAPNSSSVVDWEISGTEGLSGDGQFNVEYGDNDTSAIDGFGDLVLPGGCEIEFDIPEETPLNFAPNGVTPTIDVFGAELYGALRLLARVGNDEIESILTTVIDSNNVQATDVSINGLGDVSFNFDLDIDSEAINQMFSCLLGGLQVTSEVFNELGNILGSVLFDEEYAGDIVVSEGLPPWTFTATQENLETTGTVAVAGLPVIGQPLSATLSFNLDTSDNAVTASASPLIPLTFQGTLQEGNEVEDAVVFGRVEVSFTPAILVQLGDLPDRCDLTLIIPESNPISADSLEAGLLDGINVGARMFLEVRAEGNVLKIALVGVSDGEDGSEVQVTGALFNGIPIPGSLIGG